MENKQNNIDINKKLLIESQVLQKLLDSFAK